MQIQRRKSTKRACRLEAYSSGPYPSLPVQAPSPHHGGLNSPLGSHQAQGTATFFLPAHDSPFKAASYTVVSKQINPIIICVEFECDSSAGRAKQQLPVLELS